jgi:predicted O-methyltransferase YrrM
MNQARWDQVDDYICDSLIPEDPVLEEALAASAAAGLPKIQVSAPQGKLLNLIARTVQATAILEIGTLGGYSTIWLARALKPGGSLITLEINPTHVQVARANLAKAGFAESAEVMLGPAVDSLAKLAANKRGPFDLVFIDADKQSIPKYLQGALTLSRPGTVIICDNVIRGGAVADKDSQDLNVQGVRRFHEMVAADPRLDATAIQTVGCKGYDGFTYILVKSPT